MGSAYKNTNSVSLPPLAHPVEYHPPHNPPLAQHTDSNPFHHMLQNRNHNRRPITRLVILIHKTPTQQRHNQGTERWTLRRKLGQAWNSHRPYRGFFKYNPNVNRAALEPILKKSAHMLLYNHVRQIVMHNTFFTKNPVNNIRYGVCSISVQIYATTTFQHYTPWYQIPTH